MATIERTTHAATPRDAKDMKYDGVSRREKMPDSRAFRFAELSIYTFKERLMIRAADLVFYALIQIIARTVHIEIEDRGNWEAANAGGTQPNAPIFTLWHNRIFLTIYILRQTNLVVMTSRSFDGEYIARFLQRFGYGAARGSSTRGGGGALIEMIRLMRAGFPAAFTIDGPKGPRYEAKMGAVMLAKKTGQPILPIAVNAESYWQIKSWDGFQIPKPFTRARMRIAPPILVALDANDETMRQKRDELQRALDSITEDSSKSKTA